MQSIFEHLRIAASSSEGDSQTEDSGSETTTSQMEEAWINEEGQWEISRPREEEGGQEDLFPEVQWDCVDSEDPLGLCRGDFLFARCEIPQFSSLDAGFCVGHTWPQECVGLIREKKVGHDEDGNTIVAVRVPARATWHGYTDVWVRVWAGDTGFVRRAGAASILACMQNSRTDRDWPCAPRFQVRRASGEEVHLPEGTPDTITQWTMMEDVFRAMAAKLKWPRLFVRLIIYDEVFVWRDRPWWDCDRSRRRTRLIDLIKTANLDPEDPCVITVVLLEPPSAGFSETESD